MTQARALYEFVGSEPNHLSFPVDAVIAVIQDGDAGWWNGAYEGAQGWFPASYVTVIDGTEGNADTDGIAEPVAAVELPPNWEQCQTEDGVLFYMNSVTKESSWEIPTGDAVSHDHTTDAVGDVNDTFDDSEDEFDDGLGDDKDIVDQQQYRLSTRSESLIQESDRVQSEDSLASESSADRFNKDRVAFVDNFWGDRGPQSGFDLLVLKHRNGKEVCKDMAEFLRERSLVEEQYAKGLAKLAATKLADEEEGTLKTAWNQIKMDIGNQAKAHQKFSQQLSNDLDRSIMTFKDTQKKSRKAYEKIIADEKRNIAAKVPAVEKTHKIYQERYRETEIWEAKEAKGQLDTMTKMDFMKVQAELSKHRKRCDQAADEYRKTIDDYNISLKSWEDAMINACMEFEDNEVERSKFLREQLIKYAQFKKTVNDQSSQSLTMVENSVNACDVFVDIEMFIKTKGTGSFRPMPLQFGDDVSSQQDKRPKKKK